MIDVFALALAFPLDMASARAGWTLEGWKAAGWTLEGRINMKARKYRVQKNKHWHNLDFPASGINPDGPAYIVTIIPTVKNVRATIAAYFPDCVIDERYMSLKEQIADGIDIDSFSISLYTPGVDLESRSISFDWYPF